MSVPGWQHTSVYQPQAPVPRNASRRRWLRRLLLTGIAVTLFLLCALVLVGLITQSAGATGALLGALSASTAIGIVVPVFLWVDRMESEPARVMWFAFLWGALVSTLGAVVLNELGVAFFGGLEVDPTIAGPVFVAPLVEESLKCLGVLLIFLLARREFNGIVDGIVYAGIVAAGFAFVENILYLGINYQEFGTEGLVSVFIVRCLVSPFIHPMFTVCFGLGLGIIAYRRTLAAAFIPALGFVAAVFLHGLWNFAAVSSDVRGFFTVYVLVQVPLFIAFLIVLIWARRRETRLMREQLTGYGINGWFTPAEVSMLTSPRERRKARAWARRTGGRRAARAMETFQDDATELAVARRHLERGDSPDLWVPRERELLQLVQQGRATFAPQPPSGMPGPPHPGPPPGPPRQVRAPLPGQPVPGHRGQRPHP